MNTRELKGKEIAARLKIVRKENKWIVPSQTGKGKYTVDIDGEVPHCTCPDYELRGLKCKHIYAVEYTIKHECDFTTILAMPVKHIVAVLLVQKPVYIQIGLEFGAFGM